MNHLLLPAGSGTASQIFLNGVLLVVGSIICAVAVNGILIPQNFLSSGFTGASLIIHYLVPSLSVGVIYLLLNIPVFIAGWSMVGKRFFFYSVAGTVIYSLALTVIRIDISIENKILSALLAGIIYGTGSGIILRSYGSAGGTDILAVILQKLMSIQVGTTSLAVNCLILVSASLLFSLEDALYTLAYIYVSAHFMNLVVVGLSKRKAVMIISDHWENISREILKKDRRGVTIIEGTGGYKKDDKRIIYSVVTFQDLPQLKKMISKIDPKAFVVVMDTLEVMGARMGNQPHW
ncbi:MAG: YitT family protein [Pseudomonadota bacterium]|nr:YitT family protein [Deltaproteobacteria bacterium]MDI9542669.1 YitT family protein [Pseudomonadota bacterium]